MEKGLAMTYTNFTQDKDNLKVNWWYDWGINHLDDPTYVPMMRSGLETSLPQDYDGFCLIFCEPENKEPNGYPLTSTEMVAHYANALYYHPKTKFIVGGVGWNYYKTLADFKTKCIAQGISLPYGWHVHAYIYRSAGYTVGKIEAGLLKFKALTGEIWITEYAAPDSNSHTLPDFKSLTTWIIVQNGWINRFSAYTNRQSGTNVWEIGKGCNLIDFKTGELTAIGKYYSGV